MNFYFNGTSAADFGVVVEEVPEEIFGERRGDMEEVPGRHGAVEVPDDTLRPYTQPFQIHFPEGERGQVRRRARQLAAWLLGSKGFCRLETDYEPDHFRLAKFSGPLNVAVLLRRWGSCTLDFFCQPQRFLKTGEDELHFAGREAAYTLLNPTGMEAQPLIRAVLAANHDPVQRALARSYTLTSGETSKFNYLYSTGVYGGAAAESARAYTTLPVGVSGAYKVLARCCAMAFFSAGGQVIDFYKGSGRVKATICVELEDMEVEVPEGASYVILQSSELAGEPELWTLEAPGVTDARVDFMFGTCRARVKFGDRRTVYLDCATQNAYYPDGKDANHAVQITRPDGTLQFPTLGEGETTISNDDPAAYTSPAVYADLYVTPRWWDP